MSGLASRELTKLTKLNSVERRLKMCTAKGKVFLSDLGPLVCCLERFSRGCVRQNRTYHRVVVAVELVMLV